MEALLHISPYNIEILRCSSYMLLNEVINEVYCFKEFITHATELLKQFEETVKADAIPIFFGIHRYINAAAVDSIYEALRELKPEGDVAVILFSSGGDVDEAYLIAKLLQTLPKGKLTTYIPRYAKSSATLIACASDEIVMLPPAELGPIDPVLYDPKTNKYIPLQSILEIIDIITKKEHTKRSTKRIHRQTTSNRTRRLQKSSRTRNRTSNKTTNKKNVQKQPRKSKTNSTKTSKLQTTRSSNNNRRRKRNRTKHAKTNTKRRRNTMETTQTMVPTHNRSRIHIQRSKPGTSRLQTMERNNTHNNTTRNNRKNKTKTIPFLNKEDSMLFSIIFAMPNT